MDKTLILGVPLKRRAHPTRPGAWYPIMTTPDVRISAEAWVHFVAVAGLEQIGPNLFRDSKGMEYTFERRRDNRA